MGNKGTPETIPGLFRAKQTFSTTVRGVPLMVHKDDLVRNSDPIVKGRGELFEAFAPKIRDFTDIFHPPKPQKPAKAAKADDPSSEPSDEPSQTDGKPDETGEPSDASGPDEQPEGDSGASASDEPEA